MSIVQMGSIRTYEDAEAIRGFVREALHLDPKVAAVLGRREPPPLVVVKPNWVQQAHEYAPDVWEPVITHPRVVLAVVESVAEEMRGSGVIAICDAPNTYADFERIVARGDLRARLGALRTRWPSLEVQLIDLRREVWILKDEVIVDRRENPPDPRGYVALNLGRDSLLYGFRGEGRYYGADYDAGVVNRHHQGAVQEYLIAGTAMACDLFVNVAKLKTHKKTGITCCLKNLVGINGDKNWLPHHTEGTPDDGGDEFPVRSTAQWLETVLKRVGREVALTVPVVGPWAFRYLRRAGKPVLGDSQVTIRNGNWQGNDTCWRMALDLNRALLYGNHDGSWRETEPKAYLGIVDGIIGGEGNGPLCPEPVESGVMLAGTNPAAVDSAACRLMGLEPRELPLVARAFDPHRWPIIREAMDHVTVLDRQKGKRVPLHDLSAATPGGFRPHFGWAHLSRPRPSAPSVEELARY